MKDNRPKKITTVSIYHDQTEKFKELGGSKWLRRVIDSKKRGNIQMINVILDNIIKSVQALKELMLL